MTSYKSLLFISLFLLGSLSFSEAYAKPKYVLNWYVSHGPERLIQPSIDHFVKKVETESKGEIQVKITMGSEVYQKEPNPMNLVIGILSRNQYQMAQIFTNALAAENINYWALELPFLFRDDEHVFKVLDGPIGQNLSADVLKNTGVLRPVAYTYSGGFKVICLNKEVKSYEDLRGLKVFRPVNYFVGEMFNELGANVVNYGGPRNKIAEDMASGQLNAFEAAYPRIAEHPSQMKSVKHIFESRHSVIISTLVLNEKFYQTLPDNFKKLVTDATMEAALLERKNSALVGAEIRADIVKQGIKMTVMAQSDKDAMTKKLTKYNEKYNSFFPNNLVEEIRKTK